MLEEIMTSEFTEEKSKKSSPKSKWETNKQKNKQTGIVGNEKESKKHSMKYRIKSSFISHVEVVTSMIVASSVMMRTFEALALPTLASEL